MKKHFFKIYVSISLIMAISATVSALETGSCFSGISSVDNGEIRYDYSTKYFYSLHEGLYQWHMAGPINIFFDNFWSVKDLQFKDTNVNHYWLGLYNPVGADTITFNTVKLDSVEYSDDRIQTVIHETGHALGFTDHKDGTSCDITDCCMGLPQGFTYIQPHDYEMYNHLY